MFIPYCLRNIHIYTVVFLQKMNNSGKNLRKGGGVMPFLWAFCWAGFSMKQTFEVIRFALLALLPLFFSSFALWIFTAACLRRSRAEYPADCFRMAGSGAFGESAGVPLQTLSGSIRRLSAFHGKRGVDKADRQLTLYYINCTGRIIWNP